MKLNTLLLTSAATLMMTSVAFAADLPSKKAAPSAGSVQVCKVGGMTGFTLPGSDTCLQISGRVTVDFGFDSEDDDTFGAGTPFGNLGAMGYRLNFDARSNSDLGVVRSFIGFTNESFIGYSDSDTGVRKAFIQVGGFTAGLKDSLADIAGTVGNFYGSGTSQSSYGVDYKVAVGDGMTLAIGAEMSQSDESGNYPDLIARLSGSAGGLNYSLVGVTAQDDDDDNVYAVLGQVNTKIANGVSLYVFAGMGDATWYIDDENNCCGTDAGEVNNVIGAGLTFEVSKSLAVTLEGRTNDGDQYSDSEQTYSISANYNLAKGLFIAPEAVMYDNGDTEMYVRIQRDF